LVTALGTAAALIVGLLALIWLFQRRLIYIPLERDVPPARALLPTAEEVFFTTEDELRLHGWFVPARDPARSETVLVFNGNAGNRSFRAPLAEALSDRGLAVLLFDYRGYADNAGSPSESGLLADARGARAYLQRRTDVDGERIVYFGESLGAAVALGLAVEQPPAALILRSPFTSLVDMGRVHYPFLPVGWLLSDRYLSVERVARLESPLLVVAGGRDGIVPPSQSRELFDAAPIAAKRFVLVDAADHNDYELLAGRRLIEEVMRFLAETPAPSTPAPTED
jgi:fermentation-respiration switch protein FrsA (DUF1100 family)